MLVPWRVYLKLVGFRVPGSQQNLRSGFFLGQATGSRTPSNLASREAAARCPMTTGSYGSPMLRDKSWDIIDIMDTWIYSGRIVNVGKYTNLDGLAIGVVS